MKLAGGETKFAYCENKFDDENWYTLLLEYKVPDDEYKFVDKTKFVDKIKFHEIKFVDKIKLVDLIKS